MFLKEIIPTDSIGKNCLQILQIIFNFATDNSKLCYRKISDDVLAKILFHDETGLNFEGYVNNSYQIFEINSHFKSSQISHYYFEPGKEAICAKIYIKSLKQEINYNISFIDNQIFYCQEIISDNDKKSYKTKINANNCNLCCNDSLKLELDNNENSLFSINHLNKMKSYNKKKLS